MGFWLPVVLGLLAVGKMIIDSYASVTKPNIEQDKELIEVKKDIASLIEEKGETNRKIGKMGGKVELLLTNHIPHINQELVKIGTILEERLPRKQ